MTKKIDCWVIGLSALAAGIFIGDDLTSSKTKITEVHHCGGEVDWRMHYEYSHLDTIRAFIASVDLK